MRFVLAIKNRLEQLVIFGLIGLTSSMAFARIDVNSLGTHSPMAEQGGICASFSALMENQALLNDDLGLLWQERRKFSGAVIRRAVELSGAPTPSGEDIDLLIGDYQEWILLNLTSQNEDEKSLSDYQTNLRMMVATNCANLYKQADKAIIKRFPKLTYLINGLENGIDDTAEKQAEMLLRKNIELNQKIVALNKQLEATKTELAAQTALAKTKAAIAVAENKTKKPEPKPTPKPKSEPIKTTPAPRPSVAAKEADQNTALMKPEPQSDAARFYGQLGSYSSSEIAMDAIDDLRTRFPQLFDKMKLMVNNHKFASGKIFYRVTTGDADMASISQICDELWDERLGCLIKTRTP